MANVGSLDALSAAEAAEVRDRCREAIAEIEAAVRTAWLPLSLDIELTRAVEQVCGRLRMREWSRDAIARSAEGPLLRPFLEGLRTLGLNPSTTLRLAPRAWDTIYRHCGALTFEPVGEREVALIQSGAPEIVLTSVPYQYGISGGFEGAMEIAGGLDVEVVPEADRGAARVRYACTWS